MGIFDTFKKIGGAVINGNVSEIIDATVSAISETSMETAAAGAAPKTRGSVKEVANADELKAICLATRNKIISAENGETAISYALSAQLKVIEVLNSPEMSVSPFELMIEALDRAVAKARSEEERSDLQVKAAVMTNNMIFFMEAKLYYEKNLFKKEGEKLLMEACGMLAETATGLLAASTGVGAGIGVKIVGDTLYRGIKEGFIKKIFKLIFQKKRIEEYREEFYMFLSAAFDRLRRNSEVFGKSRLLKELILRYKDPLAGDPADNKRKRGELKEFDPHNAVQKKYQILSLLYVVLHGIFLGFQIFFLFNWWGGDTWLETVENDGVFYSLFSIHFSILGIPFLLKLLIVSLTVLYYFGYTLFLSYRNKTIAGEYYRCVANLFG